MPHGRCVMERSVIDYTANRTLIYEKVVRRLGAKTIKGGRSERVLLVARAKYGSSQIVETYAEVRKTLDGITPSKSVDARIMDEFQVLQCSMFIIEAPIGIRLGCDVYSKINVGPVYIFAYLISGLCSYNLFFIILFFLNIYIPPSSS